MNISLNLQAIAEKLRLSESDIAKRTGLNQPTVHRMMSGETSDPGASKLFAIKKGLGVSYEQIIEGKELKELEVKETQGIYISTNNHNRKEKARIQRICDFINHWIINNDYDRQAWFEEDFKLKHEAYSKWLKNKK